MSGVISKNISVASGQIAAAATSTESASNPTMTENPEAIGAEWHNTTSGQIFICTDNTANLNKWVGQTGTGVGPTRGVYANGESSSGAVGYEGVSYITIDNVGDATDWADRTAYVQVAGGSNGSNDRGVWAGGKTSGTPTNAMGYFTITSSSYSEADFGNLTLARRSTASCSNTTNERCVWMGGEDSSSSRVNTMDYITINSASDATNFANIQSPGRRSGGSTSNGTNERGIYGGGFSGSTLQAIIYITISTLADSSTFGDLLSTSYGQVMSAVSNLTNERCVWLGGSTPGTTNILQYVTISSTGDATDFGDFTVAVNSATGVSSGRGERGVFGGGDAPSDQIGYITINTTGDATDFGDLVEAVQEPAGVDNAG